VIALVINATIEMQLQHGVAQTQTMSHKKLVIMQSKQFKQVEVNFFWLLLPAKGSP